MNKPRILIVATIFLVFIVGLFSAFAELSSAPWPSIKEAIQIAETHAKIKNIETKGMHIASAVHHTENGNPLWVITWKSDQVVKGGWFEVRVKPNRKCEVAYGE